MKMKIPVFLVILLLSSAVHLTLYGGTTGKITGQITDAGTGEALIGLWHRDAKEAIGGQTTDL